MTDADVVRTYRTDEYPVAPPADADMVMKGGITSGVVYPLAVCELAKQYRFRNVGGTSAGGIAAAFAAAAEYRRSVAPGLPADDPGRGDGFRALAGLPEKLGRVLKDLFQPSTGTRAAFDVFTALTDNTAPKRRRIARALLSMLRAQRRYALLAGGVVVLLVLLGVMLAAGAPHDLADWGWLALALVPALPIVAVAVLLGIAYGTVRHAAKGVTDNGYGLCIGSGTPTCDTKPFTDWMHDELNATAGKSDGPLTIGDLWGAEAVARYRQARLRNDDVAGAMRGAQPVVRLEMMTTNVTFCRPTRMPFADDRYLYCETELARWFPADVMAALRTRELDPEDGTCPDHGVPLRRLPEPPDFPVVVAVRLTLSFPALISPVPLFARDFSGEERDLVRCHFSDGGISSNFPIHFFDSMWPSRPTFGISLAPHHPKREQTPFYYPGSAARRQPRVRDTTTLGGFVAAIRDTLQNWADEGQSMLPGYSDRIVEVHLSKQEGGLNLAMAPETILALAVRGAQAGAALREKFDFDTHKWKRYLTAMAELQEAVTTMAGRYDPAPDGSAPGYRAFLARQRGRYDYAAAFIPLTDQLLTFAGRPAPAKLPKKLPDFVKVEPRPLPDLRITPHF